MRPNATFWRAKRVLLTGHTGFKGGWLGLWLHRLGAEVTGLALAPATQPSLFDLARFGELAEHHVVDLRDAAVVAAVAEAARPEIVLHLAAQPLVRASYQDPLTTYATNVMGTVHLLEALRGQATVRVVVIATTDKVYANLGETHPFREDDPLGGHDPYSASKAATEIVAASYRDSFFRAEGVALATARAGNVIGGGDWSEDRLIADAVRAWQVGTPLLIRRPQAVRPWQHVLDALASYLRLTERLWDEAALAGAYNFGPEPDEAATVRDVITLAREAYGVGECVFGDGVVAPHEAGWLTLDVARARNALGVATRWPLHEAVTRTMKWYRALGQGGDARTLCEADIAAYEAVQ